jgi:hypothetical protein
MDDKQLGNRIVTRALNNNPDMARYLRSIYGSRRKKQILVDEIAELTARPILECKYKNFANEIILKALRIRNRFI